MNGVELLLNDHAAIVEFWAFFWLISAAVSALPAPTTGSTPFYNWLYKFLQSLCASLKQVNIRGGEGRDAK